MVVVTIREGGVREVFSNDLTPVFVLDYDIDGDEDNARIFQGEPCLIHQHLPFSIDDDFISDIKEVLL